MRLLLASLCAMLWSAQAYAATTASFGDFDGDGYRDRFSIDAAEPSIVRVWLSATRSTHIIHSAQPLRAVIAADLNGDHRAELIAATRSSGLHVWTKASSGFRIYHRKRPDPRTFHRPDRRSINDDDDDAAGTVAAAKPGPPPAAAMLHRRGPPDATHLASRELNGVRCARLPSALYSPRPPPLL
jgi:hypothetical protein